MADVTFLGASDQVTARNTLVETTSVYATAGEKAGANLRSIVATRAVAAADLTTTATVYNMIRLPSHVRVKELMLRASTAMDTSSTTTLAWDVGAAYSNAPSQSPPVLDGTQTAKQAATPSATTALIISGSYFLAAGKFGGGANTGSLGNNYDIPANASWTLANRNKPLWEALGLASDPGGYIDIYAKVQAAATTSATATIALVAKFD